MSKWKLKRNEMAIHYNCQAKTWLAEICWLALQTQVDHLI